MAAAQTLVLNVSGIEVGRGDVRIGVFDAAEEFPYGASLKGLAVAGDAKNIRIEVTGLPPGRYAISLMQDFNGNEKLDKYAIGMPKEPYGFSGKWKRRAASFDDAIIELQSGGTEISIKMKYKAFGAIE
jgi:uncharacterized protein (DUF2141 family)